MVQREYYENKMDDEGVDIYKMVRILSWGIMKMTPKLKEGEDFIPTYEAFHQIVIASQSIYPVNEKECVRRQMNIVKAYDVVLNSLRTTGSEENGRLMPIIEDERFQKKIIQYHHKNSVCKSVFGKRIHNSAELVMRKNYSSEFGISACGFKDQIIRCLRLVCRMLLAGMKCDFQPNEIFNILKIHTYIHVIPHFQGMSFYFRVKKKV